MWTAAAIAVWFAVEIRGFALSGDLQGLNKSDSTNWHDASAWVGSNLRGWQELDMVACRVVLHGPASNSPVSISFPRTRKGAPAFDNLYFISNSPNATVTGLILYAPAEAEEWSYSMDVTIEGEEPAYIYFHARLAAGVHLNTGSTLQIRGEPALSPLQIHKPRPAFSKPDLGVAMTVPALALPGETLIYSIRYTNSALGSNDTSHGVVLTATLPPFADYVDGSASGGGSIAGNILTWNLSDLDSQEGGSVSFKVVVAPAITLEAPLTVAAGTLGAVLTTRATIDGAENDLNPADNFTSATTCVAANNPGGGGALRITRIKKFDDEIYHVYFQTMSERSYVMQYTEDFSEWTTIPTVIPGTGTEVVSRQREVGAKRFYRVMELQ